MAVWAFSPTSSRTSWKRRSPKCSAGAPLENRFLLEAQARRFEETIGAGDALNVVLHPGKSTRMIEFELFIDGQFVCSQKADGLIVATPTGSTAYALSAGGPIMHPRLDAIVIVPMYPHTLSSRPIVVDGNSELKIVVSSNIRFLSAGVLRRAEPFHLRTGRYRHRTQEIAEAAPDPPAGSQLLRSLRTKLGWGSRLGEGGATWSSIPDAVMT
ncbi:NAD kinase OS=Stutzerimonas stutzeri OX=316 GN=nadK PE=3 SV=1 [Stutzerimonas stutzeri]